MNYAILGYGLLVAIGGIIGYIKVQSQTSLISGVGSGVALAIAWWVSLQNMALGLAMATMLALALLIVFGLRLRKTGKFMPAGLLAILSLGATLLFASGWIALQFR